VQRLYRLVISTVFLPVILAATVSAGELLFVKETIAVSVLPPDTVRVKGDYFFSTTGQTVTDAPLIYPFPVDSPADYPYHIEVHDLRTAKAIPFARQDKSIAFNISVKAGDTVGVAVFYKQHVRGRRGCYILTTTGLWGRPLIDSRYSVSIPAGVTLDFMSYECDSIVSAGDRLVYQFFKKKFMPDRDLTFSWTDASPAGSK
jgi:hypothetical protein